MFKKRNTFERDENLSSAHNEGEKLRNMEVKKQAERINLNENWTK